MSSNSRGWIGVDLDGTLAEYNGWIGIEHIGNPIPAMLERVKNWLEEGKKVKIFTARVCPQQRNRADAIMHIEKWCEEHIGKKLPVTCIKDFSMVELWDDRCVQVGLNTGIIIGENK